MRKIVFQHPFSEHYRQMASSFGICDAISFETAEFILSEVDGLVTLTPTDKTQGGAICCNFLSTEFQRYLSSVSRKSLIAKVCGLKQGRSPSILDISAGLGKDAVTLANLGANLTMVEANPCIYLMLHSGIEQLRGATKAVSSAVELLPCQDAMQFFAQSTETFDVVYFDPMFPERKKSAKVKKAMQYFHRVVGEDHNTPANIFAAATERAKERLVIKRPKGSDFYGNVKPSYSLESKVIRFDIYLT